METQGRIPLADAVAIIVPLAGQLAEHHDRGETFYVHPSSLSESAGGFGLDEALCKNAPELPRDKFCLAPEERSGAPGNARASVFALGAILYELVTGEHIGPGMRRPTDVVPDLPPALEGVLGKALVADPKHRPDDLRALAQAIHHLAPRATAPPPAADESHLDHDGDMDVDVSLSILPPPAGDTGTASPYDMAVSEAPTSQQPDHYGELASLKARLESDPRPRYVVIKDGMDHGPFSAVELLQQIASHTFVEDDILQDQMSMDERAIKDWEEFEPFAKHARLHRDIKAEKAAIERVVVEEKKSTRGKALIFAAVIGVVLIPIGIYIGISKGTKDDSVAVQGESVTNIETQGNLNVPKKAKAKAVKGVSGTTAEGIPILGGGMSCEGAVAKYNEVIKLGEKVPADITRAQYGAVLNNGSYLGGCGVPDSMKVNICAAVQNGRAVGVTVTTDPKNPSVASCVAGKVRGLSFPAHPKLDVTRTAF